MTVAAAEIYGAYAPIYDAIGQGRFSVRMVAWALGWLDDHGARAERVLDMACGTGEAALAFGTAGCSVVGVDRSAAMLEIARGKARDAGCEVAFAQGDIRELSSYDQTPKTNDQRTDDGAAWSLVVHPRSFDLATCFYDSLNYLVDDSDLERVFGGVAEMLRPGGYLVFDINTTAEYATWDERDAVTYDGRDCLVYNKLSYDPVSRQATGRIAWFVRELDRWWRGEETHIVRAWSDAEVCAALARAGLILVGRWDVEGRPASDEAARIVYVARKQS
jgi:SAM-dependent methyltransferase